jgi:cation diffusion facilitator CzcD-associated flavoprotein CzcO
MSMDATTGGSRRSLYARDYDAVVVGAGPYGLSTAAHLLGRGLNVGVFGKPLELWREHMPNGMLLKSQWWNTNLSDPRRQFSFERFFRETGNKKCYPVPRELFIDYALWFKDRAVPDVDETYVSSVERRDGHFVLTLEDGRTVRSAAVVMATGLCYYANRPDEYEGLPAELVSHTCDHKILSKFKGREVIVVGRGQSAIEFAVLLREVGATVHLVSRRPIEWLPPDRMMGRGVLEQITGPNSAFGPGWKPWILHHVPYLFYRYPQSRKDNLLRGSTTATAADWLRQRLAHTKPTLHEGHSIVELAPIDGKVDVAISDGHKIRADQVILATGYKVDVTKLTMIHPSLRADIQSDMAIPVLRHSFESSVPGLYFVGLTSMRAFGPLYRFVAGCGAAAERVASSLARATRTGASLRHADARVAQ